MRFLIWLTLTVIASQRPSHGMSPFTKASVKFSLNFLRTAYNLDPSKNGVFSPIAIQRAFSMLHHAARDDVSKQMETLLGLPQDLQSLPDGQNSQAMEMITKVYHSQMELKPHLLTILQADHDVDVQALDFSRQERIVHVVNNWAYRFTNGIVEDVFSPQGLADDANLVMINTLTLNASWEAPFNPRSTAKEAFLFDDGVREVDMLRKTSDYRVAQINDLQVVELPFERSTDLSMLIIKSDSRPLANVIDKFDLNTYRQIDDRLETINFELNIPKFSISTGLEAKVILDTLGLSSVFSKDAFEVFADFTSKLANVYQILRLDIDENGTKAAAGTHMTKIMPKMIQSSYSVDCPFMFLIRKKLTKDVFFVGHFSRRG